MKERIVNVNHEADYEGKHFRSSLEVQTAKVLDALGIPYQYEERKIELIEGFRTPFQKNKVKSCIYIPDFTIGPIMLECKGFETPEWKIKKKLLFKWLMENEPDTIFYQIHDAKKSLLEIIDKHLVYLDMVVQVTSKPTKRKPAVSMTYDSIKEAVADLNVKVPMGAILSSLTGKRDYAGGYKWKLVKNLT